MFEIVKPTFFIRSFTYNKERAKQYFTLWLSDCGEYILSIRKLILTKDFESYIGRYTLLKRIKGVYLFEQVFSIKMSTLNKMLTKLKE